MKIGGVHYRSIAVTDNGWSVRIIDQRKLPWRLEWVELTSADMAAEAIRDMWTRGAPLIGATAAYGLAMALRADPSDASLELGLHTIAGDPANGDQSQMGARPDGRRGAAFASRGTRGGGLRARRGNL